MTTRDNLKELGLMKPAKTALISKLLLEILRWSLCLVRSSRRSILLQSRAVQMWVRHFGRFLLRTARGRQWVSRVQPCCSLNLCPVCVRKSALFHFINETFQDGNFSWKEFLAQNLLKTEIPSKNFRLSLPMAALPSWEKPNTSTLIEVKFENHESFLIVDLANIIFWGFLKTKECIKWNFVYPKTFQSTECKPCI